jgi:hypothetical protein
VLIRKYVGLNIDSVPHINAVDPLFSSLLLSKCRLIKGQINLTREHESVPAGAFLADQNTL